MRNQCRCRARGACRCRWPARAPLEPSSNRVWAMTFAGRARTLRTSGPRAFQKNTPWLPFVKAIQMMLRITGGAVFPHWTLATGPIARRFAQHRRPGSSGHSAPAVDRRAVVEIGPTSFRRGDRGDSCRGRSAFCDATRADRRCSPRRPRGSRTSASGLVHSRESSPSRVRPGPGQADHLVLQLVREDLRAFAATAGISSRM